MALGWDLLMWMAGLIAAATPLDKDVLSNRTGDPQAGSAVEILVPVAEGSSQPVLELVFQDPARLEKGGYIADVYLGPASPDEKPVSTLTFFGASSRRDGQAPLSMAVPLDAKTQAELRATTVDGKVPIRIKLRPPKPEAAGLIQPETVTGRIGAF